VCLAAHLVEFATQLHKSDSEDAVAPTLELNREDRREQLCVAVIVRTGDVALSAGDDDASADRSSTGPLCSPP